MGEDGQERERWSSRLAFITAAVGAAIGYGNVWRFPALAYKYGGGAFFIPYLLALFFIGIPITILEISLGQYYQTSDAGAFGTIHPRFRGIGVMSVLCSYFLVVFYVGTLITWTLRAFFESFSSENAEIWATDEAETGSDMAGYAYFKDEIMGLETIGDDMIPTRIVPENVGYLVLSWVLVFLALAFGIATTGRITYVTMGTPVVFIFIFMIRAITLEGSEVGIKKYIGEWDMSVLTETPDVWSTAVTQIFFSIGITFGIMTAFGSHCERNEPAVFNATVIALSNTFFSIVAGFGVFGVIGYMSVLEGKDIEDLDLGGTSLAFGTYPLALSKLKGGIHWVRLFFFMLFLLGIDSAFALLESVNTVLRDSTMLRNVSRRKITMATCTFGLIAGLLYCTDAGLFFLDVVDFYINFVMLLVGYFECLCAGWMYDIDDQIEKIGFMPVFLYFMTTHGGFTLAAILWFNLPEDAMMWGFIALAASYVVGFTLIMCSLSGVKKQKPDHSYSYMLFVLLFENVLRLTRKLRTSVGFLPNIWAMLIKHIIPPILLVLFINLASADASDTNSDPQFGNYGGYPMWPYQILGYVIVGLAFLTFIFGLFLPSTLSCMAPTVDESTLGNNVEEVVEDTKGEALN